MFMIVNGKLKSSGFFQLNIFEFTKFDDLQIFIKRYIYMVSNFDMNLKNEKI